LGVRVLKSEAEGRVEAGAEAGVSTE